MQTKIINNCTWVIVTETAEKLFKSGKHELFKLYPDGSESLIEFETDLIDAKQKEFEIGYLVNVNAMQDLFETPEKIPAEVNAILDKYREGEHTYTELSELQSELQKVGFTIDYYLDAIPYNLRAIGAIGEFKQIIHSK